MIEVVPVGAGATREDDSSLANRRVGTMYLFTRRTRLAPGSGTAGVEWAASICPKVKSITGQDVELWAHMYSPGAGTITWTTWFSDLSALEQVSDQLQADSSFQKLADQGSKHTVGGLDDGLLEPIFGEPTNTQPQYVGGAVAVAAAGGLARAMGAGVEIAQKAESVTGLPSLFVRSLTGPFGSVGWLTGYDSAATMEKAQAALGADPSWLALIDSTQGCWVEDPSTTQATIYRRVV